MNEQSSNIQSPALLDQATLYASEKPQGQIILSETQKEAIESLNLEFQKTLDTFSPNTRQAKEQLILSAFQALSHKLMGQEVIEFGELQQAILKLKLARHFQKFEETATLDVNTLYDAILESPKFISTSKGSLNHLLKVHQVKTLQKIAEIRRRRLERGDKAGNPYENLFTTSSGKYYVARLLNMPHLEAESDYMRHCVGTSDSYINKMKRGDVEIFSFRSMPEINTQTQKLEGDVPLVTIEYNLRTKTIEQIKKQKEDEYLSSSETFFEDLIDALKQLKTTTSDSGGLRDFTRIAPSELEHFIVKENHVLTENGVVSIQDVDLDSDVFIFKAGRLPIDQNTSPEIIVKILQIVEGIKYTPDEVAQTKEQITSRTKVYIGKAFPNIVTLLPDHIERAYTSFPYGKIIRESIMIGGRTGEQYNELLHQKGIKLSLGLRGLFQNPECIPLKPSEKINLVSLTVRDLGFLKETTTDLLFQKARELGLKLCPPVVTLEYLLQHLNLEPYQWHYIGMDAPAVLNSGSNFFRIGSGYDGLEIGAMSMEPNDRWEPTDLVMFCHH